VVVHKRLQVSLALIDVFEFRGQFLKRESAQVARLNDLGARDELLGIKSGRIGAEEYRRWLPTLDTLRNFLVTALADYQSGSVILTNLAIRARFLGAPFNHSLSVDGDMPSNLAASSDLPFV
jgi:hypothetical protein